MSKANIVALLADMLIAWTIWAMLYLFNYRPNRHLVPELSEKERLSQSIQRFKRVFITSGCMCMACLVGIGYQIYQSFDDPMPIKVDIAEGPLLYFFVLSFVAMLIAGLCRSSFIKKRYGKYVPHYEG